MEGAEPEMTVELNEVAVEAAIDKAQSLTTEMSGGVAVPRQATAYITRETLTAYEEAKAATE